ncbi:MAG: alpha/beta hydrolase fold domain-containing protein [Lachnospiraceae bacterium]|nr:alpha/beta hydrolase fold domain-containing protein [Lachnospiraceae bacterium]
MAQQRVIKELQKLKKDELRDLALANQAQFTNELPQGSGEKFELIELRAGKYKYYRLVPKEKFAGTYIVYLYGNGLSGYITPEHWKFIVQMAVDTGCGVYIPYYPLAPEHSCQETFSMLRQMYNDATRSFDVDRVVLMGDSSGAGLALSLAILAWKDGMRKPDQLILFSPVLDTEFFDRAIEQTILRSMDKETRFFYSFEAKEYINTYWVRDYVARTEYTSPYYEDYTDLCDDVVVFSGNKDLFAIYASSFCKKAKSQGVNTRYFEFEGETHNFMIYSETENQKNAYAYLKDILCDTYQHSLRRLYPLKLLSDWTKRYPEIISDAWASKFIYDHQFKFDGPWTDISEYQNLIMAGSQAALDEKVRRYINQFPNCTVVHFGCRLSSMFRRLDNGRIHWYSVDVHNIMSVRRSMYGEQAREKTISRAVYDFSWVDAIQCQRNKGIIFVCDDTLSYYKKYQVHTLLDMIWKRFPGAELVMTAGTNGVKFFANKHSANNLNSQRKLLVSVNDADKLFNDWRTDFHVLSEEPVSKYIGTQKGVKLRTKIGLWYNKITYNHKIIHVKLGGEAYDVSV